MFLSFIVLFLLVAPLLALYSMGYRYHRSKHQFERTGLLMVTGDPADAIVRVDGAIRASRLPARVGGLGANEYTVRVEREGFHPWEQRLTVRSGRTTFARDLLLFRAAEPALVLSGAIHAFTRSADRRHAAFVRDTGSFRETWLLDLRSQTPSLVLRLPRAHTSDIRATWSPREAFLLLTVAGDAERILLIDPERPSELRDLRGILSGRPSLVAWELGSSSHLIAAINGRLHRIHRTTERNVLLPLSLPSGLIGIARNTAYVADGSTVRAMPVDGSPPRTIAVLPDGATVEAILDLRGTTLTIATTRPPMIVTIATSGGVGTTRAGNDLERSPDDPALLLWIRDRSEVWAEHGDPLIPRLLLRLAAPVVGVRWHPEGRHVFVATTQDVAAVALDDRVGRVVTTLATFDAITAMATTIGGNALAIVGKHGREEGLWLLPLR